MPDTRGAACAGSTWLKAMTARIGIVSRMVYGVIRVLRGDDRSFPFSLFSCLSSIVLPTTPEGSR